jgi:hypothetical protein
MCDLLYQSLSWTQVESQACLADKQQEHRVKYRPKNKQRCISLVITWLWKINESPLYKNAWTSSFANLFFDCQYYMMIIELTVSSWGTSNISRGRPQSAAAADGAAVVVLVRGSRERRGGYDLLHIVRHCFTVMPCWTSPCRGRGVPLPLAVPHGRSKLNEKPPAAGPTPPAKACCTASAARAQQP